MVTFQVQQMPHGYDVEAPSFGYWLKAGMAFTLGAGIITFTAGLAWVFIGLRFAGLFLLRRIAGF